MSKFTSGPWKAEKDSSRVLYHYHIRDEKSYSIAVVSEKTLNPFIKDLSTVDENAKLIAKAPEMYELIKNLKYTVETIYNPDSVFA